MTRHEAREVAFIIIFEKSFQPEDSLDELIETAAESEFFEVNGFEKTESDLVDEAKN